MQFCLHLLPIASLCMLLTTVAAEAEQPASAKEVVARIEYPLKTPRSRDPVLGGSRDKVFFSVWIPERVKTVRGAVCNPFSKDEGVSKHWKAVCKHWNFAYVQTDFDAVKKEEFILITTALAELAKKSSHPEIEHMPLCFTGMSRGGGMSMQLAELLPERTIASAPVCLEVGPTNPATRQIPVMTIFGEKDGSQMEKLLTKLPGERKEGARWGIAVQWNRKHEFGQANNLSFVFFDEVIARRLPKEITKDKPVSLREIPLETGWVGEPATWSKDGKRAAIFPAKDYRGELDKVCWFPSQRVAAVWQAFVSGRKEITIQEPAGLGDGQAFVLHSAQKLVAVKIQVAGKAAPQSLELWDGEQKLGERNTAPWNFELTLKPGVHALYAVVKEGETTRNSRPHTIVVGE